LSYIGIRKQQQQDEQLLALEAKYPEQYVYKSLDEDLDDIICYIYPGDIPDEQWYTAILQQMLQSMVCWFHQVTGHPGEKHPWETLPQSYYHPKLRYTIKRFEYEHSQTHKLPGTG
jgi:hypothetical protein